MEDEKLRSEGKGSTSHKSSSLSISKIKRFKRIPDAEIMASIQVAIQMTVAALDLEPERDLLIHDFMAFESLSFRALGSQQCGMTDFKFHNYAPVAFKFFRQLFEIKTKNFLRSMCSEKLRQQENSGSSGSLFFLTSDDKFILKTALQREGEFLLKLLPGYYLNLTQNPRTLLPKFFGFYSYGGGNKSVRIVVMNNLIPTNMFIDKKYDLKGSTMKRKATQAELKKSFPTYKDLDFMEHHPEGLILDLNTYAEIAKALKRDCRVLESFKIIDYSLLLAVHRVDKSARKANQLPSGIPAWTTSGEELLLFVGIIDILQSYHFRKKMEHTLKSIIYEKDSISVHRPDFYSRRFQNFIVQTVFRPMPKRMSGFNESVQPVIPSSSAEKQLSANPLSLSWMSCKVSRSKKPQSVSFFRDGGAKTATSKWRNVKMASACEKFDEGKPIKCWDKAEILKKYKELRALNKSNFIGATETVTSR